jgi:hypothetical protein
MSVELILRNWHQGHAPGERLTVDDEALAKRLIRAGVGVPATVADAKAAGVDPAEAATKRAKATDAEQAEA